MGAGYLLQPVNPHSSFLQPKYPTGFLVESVNAPGVFHAIVGEIDTAIFGSKTSFAVTTDRGNNEDTVFPNDWTRM